jgi:hypothetical protein
MYVSTSCSLEFYEKHLALLPHFLKLSPLARQYFGIDFKKLTPKKYQFIELGQYSFNFGNPFTVDENTWLENFISYAKIIPISKDSLVKELAIDSIQNFQWDKNKIYLEINPYAPFDELMISLRKLLHNLKPDYLDKNFTIVQTKLKFDLLELCIKVTQLYETGIPPKKISPLLLYQSGQIEDKSIESHGGIFVSKLVRKCINIADNAFLGVYISEKAPTAPNIKI